METKGLGAGSYPQAPEIEEREEDFEIFVRIKACESFPINWGEEEKKEFIKTYLNEYLCYGDAEIEEIDL